MKKKNAIYLAILILIIGLFCVCGGLLYNYFSQSRAQQAQFEELASMVEEAREESTEATTTGSTQTPETLPEETVTEAPTEPPILPEYQALREMNPDMIGWITIEGTNIDYPVMQTPADPHFYLTHDFYGEESSKGCIYARAGCDVSQPSDNVTIFGHRMRDGSMFGNLKYYTDKSFWEAHPTVQFNTLTEYHSYRIFAVFATSANSGEGFAYHTFVDAEDEEAFQEFIDTVLGLSMYDTGIVPEYGDKILCLSTCEYTNDNGRLVVVAVRIE